MFDNEISFHLGENELKGSIDINSDIITIDESDYKPSIYSMKELQNLLFLPKKVVIIKIFSRFMIYLVFQLSFLRELHGIIL